ncbi:MAG: hypothetical protein KDI02_13625 [Anaerolineae bacterium]|nr:hypothetical protein [Anaerolineae bacterium]MCB0224725.1 hypothetical protein [Anaerolineae bacterium]MCB9107915.1 hypothetical protein [Anaerolineales bacterium]
MLSILIFLATLARNLEPGLSILTLVLVVVLVGLLLARELRQLWRGEPLNLRGSVLDYVTVLMVVFTGLSLTLRLVSLIMPMS